MDCKSKSLYVEKPSEQTSEEGVELSFVFHMTSSGLPEAAMKVIYFFSKTLAASRGKYLDGFCVPTSTLKPQMSMPHAKITHIVSEIESEEGDVDLENCHEEIEEEGRGINLSNLIASEDKNREGRQKRRMPILSIRVGITGAVSQFDDEKGNEKVKHDLFCIVRVTFLTNIQPVTYIVDYLFAPPSSNANAEAIKEYTEMSKMLEEILLYQAAHVIGDTSGKLPSSYYSEPTGMLGWSTICNPFMDPLKITELVRKMYNRVTFLKILGNSDINWLGTPSSDPEMAAYMRYYNVYAGEVHNLYRELDEALKCEGRPRRKRVKKSKGKEKGDGGGGESVGEEVPDPLHECKTFTPIFGFPIERQEIEENNFYFTKFTRLLYPICMRYFNLNYSKPTSFPNFCIEFGSLPEAVKCIMMDFLLFDYDFPNASGISEFTLVDTKPSTMADVQNKYYSNEVSNMDGLVYSGCLKHNYKNVHEILKHGLANGTNNPESVMHTYAKCDIYCTETFQGMIDSGLLQSTRIRQKNEMLEHLTKAENNKKMSLNVYEELREYKNFVLGKRSKNDANQYAQTTELLYAALVHANQSMRLNPVNLRNYLALLVSELHYVIPRDSMTVPAYGQGIFLAPACATLRELSPTKVVLPVVGCLNSAGKDYVPNQVTLLYKQLATILNFPTSKCNFVTQLTRITPASFEEAVSITFVEGKVVKLPDPQVLFTFFMDTELRGQEMQLYLQWIINFVANRGEEQQKYSMGTTLDPVNGRRSNNLRYPIMPLCLGYMCTNPQQLSQSTSEQLETLHCVSYVTPPGSVACPPESKSSKFGDVAVNSAQTRSTHLEGEAERGVPLVIALSHLMAYMKGSFPLWAGAGPLNISPVVLSVLDFIMFYIKKHLAPICKPKSIGRNFPRLSSVYISRGATFTCWTLMLQALCENEKKEDAIRQARRIFQFDALALTDVPSVGFEIICRCLHWGPIIVSCLFMQEVKMPIVPIDILVSLLRAESRPTSRDGELYSHFVKIQRWLSDCVDNGRFCPPNGCDETFTVCEYISSNDLQAHTQDGDCMFRTEKAPNGWKTISEQGRERSDNVLEKIVENILFAHKRSLLESCSFTEGSIPMIIDDMLREFSVFLPKFLEIPQSDVERFLRFFDVFQRQSFVPFKTDRDSPPPFAIKTAWFKSSREASSAGIGVNVIQLLILGAFTGEAAMELAHPTMVYALGKNIMKFILQLMPGAAVPSNQICIPSFNSIRNDTIIVRSGTSAPKLEHFIRPKDPQALTGKPTHFHNISNKFAPEDVLHMPGLCSIAGYFGFNVTDCPASVTVNYHIRKDWPYCAFNKESNELAILIYNGRDVSFTVYRNNYESVQERVVSDEDEPEGSDGEGSDVFEVGRGTKNRKQRRVSSQSDEDTSQPMEEDEKEVGEGGRAVEEEKEEQEGADEDEVKKKVLNVKTWQRELCDLGFILLPMINRAGACVTVADEDMGERIGIIMPPPVDPGSSAVSRGNFDVQGRCYYVSVRNPRGRNYVTMTPFEVFDCLIPIGQEVFLKLESDSAHAFLRRTSLEMRRDSDRSRFVIRMVM
jgi:hypothetical protein